MSQYLGHDPALGVTALGPLWSVVVEIHFYMLLPVLAWVTAWISRGSLAAAAVFLALLAAGSLAVRLVTMTIPDGAPSLFWRLNLPANFLFFVPGMLLALLRLQWERRPELRPTGSLASSNLWLVLAVPLTLPAVLIGPGFAPLIGLAAFAAVGGAVLPLRSGRAVGLLELRPLALLGIASYSLYAWHVAVIEVMLDLGVTVAPWTVLAAATLPAAIASAALSYRAIELPFLRLRRQWSSAAAAKSEGGPRVTPTQ